MYQLSKQNLVKFLCRVNLILVLLLGIAAIIFRLLRCYISPFYKLGTFEEKEVTNMKIIIIFNLLKHVQQLNKIQLILLFGVLMFIHGEHLNSGLLSLDML